MSRVGDEGALGTLAMVEVRAALAAGASPAAALVAATDEGEGPLTAVVAQLRAGRSLTDVAEDAATGEPSTDLLVRALAVAERTGAGAATAVDQAEAAARGDAELRRLLRTRTAQARGTALVLAIVPVLAWVLLVASDRTALGFYTTGLGVVTGGTALVLAACGHWWSRRLVAAAGQAGVSADPLVGGPARRDRVRPAVAAVPALAVVGLAAGPVAGLAAGGIALWLGARRWPTPRPSPGSGGAAEAVELVAVALAAGLSAAAAVAAVAVVAPDVARPALEDATRRLGNGWDARSAFAGGGLSTLGETLAVTERWGAPAAPALRRLGEELRADRRAAIEEATERTQLTLIFPTTLLMLPAFVLGVVPPLLWTAFAA